MDNLDALLQSAYQHHLAGRFAEAIEDYKAALRLDSDNAKTHYDLHLAYEQTKQIPLALEELEKAALLAYDDNDICLGRAILYDALGTKSVQELQQMISHLPEDMLNAQIVLGSLAEKQGDYQQALIHFKNALQQQPDGVGLQSHFSTCLSHLGRDAESLQALLGATCLPTASPIDWYNLAILETRKGDYAAAALAIKRAVELDENFLKGWVLSATTEIRRRRWFSVWRPFFKVLQILYHTPPH